MSKTFFISYNSADQAWAHWISWTIKGLGFEPRVHEWEIAAGENIPAWMESALGSADGMIAVVSPQFLTAKYSQAEVHAGTWRDFQNRVGFVKPIVVAPVVDWPIFLGNLKRLNLVGLGKAAAVEALADFLKEPSAPEEEPPFPGEVAEVRPLERYRANADEFAPLLKRQLSAPVYEIGEWSDGDAFAVPPAPAAAPDAPRAPDPAPVHKPAPEPDPLVEAFLRVSGSDTLTSEDEELGKALNDAGLEMKRQGRVDEALERFEAAEFLLRRVFGDGANSVAQVKSNMADALLLKEGREDLLQALQLSREAVALQEAKFGPNPVEAALSRTKVARVLLRMGGPADLEESMRVLKEAERATDNAETQRDIQGIKARILKRRRTKQDLATAYMIERKLLGAAGSEDERATAANNLGHTLWALGDHAEAEQYLQEALAGYISVYGAAHSLVTGAEASLEDLKAGQRSVFAPPESGA